MFFILRAAAQRSSSLSSSSTGRWSGQVGFPGGHVESGEDDHQAVVRECLEEVGLQLDEPGASRFLGSGHEMAVATERSRLVVACRVYEYTAARPPQLQESEVGACGWAPLSALLADDCARPLQWSDLHGARGAHWDGAPSVLLPVQDMCLADGVTMEHAKSHFVLWGLTLIIINDLLKLTGLRQVPIELFESQGGVPKL